MKRPITCLCIFLLSICFSAQAQTYITAREALELCEKNYLLIHASDLKIQQQKQLLPSAYNFYNTQLMFQSPTGEDMRLGISQIIEFPTVYTSQNRSLRKQAEVAENEREISVLNIKYQVRTTYNNLQYALKREELLMLYDSAMINIVRANELRYKTGQIPLLEKVNAEARYQLIRNQLRQSITERKNQQIQLSLLTGKPEDTTLLPKDDFKKLLFNTVTDTQDSFWNKSPFIRLYNKQTDFAKSLLRIERNRFLPGIMAGYLNQASPSTPFDLRLNYGITVPVAIWAYRSRIKSTKTGITIAETNQLIARNKLFSDYTQALNNHKQLLITLEYFESTGFTQAKLIRDNAEKSYRGGAISYYIFVQNLDQAFQVEFAYLEALRNYNSSVLTLEYLQGAL